MKKFLFLTLLVVFAISSYLCISADTSIISIDPDALGIKRVGVNAVDADYEGENHSNFRLANSNWDTKKEYNWFVPKISETRRTSYVLFGDFDMSQVESVSFAYITDSGVTSHYVSLTKDAAGTEKLATVHVTTATGGLKDPVIDSIEISNTTYSGPVYLFVEYDSDNRKIFTGNYEFTMKAAGTATEPETTEPETNVPTGDNIAVAYIIFAIGLLSLGLVFRRNFAMK